MSGGEGKRIIPGLRTIKKVINRDIVVFFAFLLISFTLWYLNSLRKTTETEIPFRVTLLSQHPGNGLNEKLQYKAYLRLSGSGFSILKAWLTSRVTPLVVDEGKTSIRKLETASRDRYYIIGADLKPVYENHFKSGPRLLSLRPDTIFLSAAREK